MCAAIGQVKFALAESVGAKLKSLTREGSDAIPLSSNSGESCTGHPTQSGQLQSKEMEMKEVRIHRTSNAQSIEHQAGRTRYPKYWKH